MTTNLPPLHEGQEWGWDGIDQRASLGGAIYNNPLFADGLTPQRKTFLDIFLHLFPLEFFTNVIIETMSNALFSTDSARTSLGEITQVHQYYLPNQCHIEDRRNALNKTSSFMQNIGKFSLVGIIANVLNILDLVSVF